MFASHSVVFHVFFTLTMRRNFDFLVFARKSKKKLKNPKVQKITRLRRKVTCKSKSATFSISELKIFENAKIAISGRKRSDFERRAQFTSSALLDKKNSTEICCCEERRTARCSTDRYRTPALRCYSTSPLPSSASCSWPPPAIVRTTTPRIARSKGYVQMW